MRMGKFDKAIFVAKFIFLWVFEEDLNNSDGPKKLYTMVWNQRCSNKVKKIYRWNS